MWLLRLNDMRTSHREGLVTVCRAETREELEELVRDETVEHYTDPAEPKEKESYLFHKTFRKDSTLEWYNRPWGDQSYVYLGTKEDHLREASYSWDRMLEEIPEAEDMY